MAGYFSNHSQPRPTFPSSPNGTVQDTRNNNNNTNGANNIQTNADSAGPRSTGPRRVPSKHFSLSVASTSPPKTPGPGSDLHPLRHTWVLWFRQQRPPGSKMTSSYEEGIKKIGLFGSIESFWTLQTHLNPPSELQATTDYLLFHAAVRRPVWEDTLNVTGGKWILRLRKGVADRIWENILLALIGDQLSCVDDESTEQSGDDGGVPQVCGITLSVRPHEDIIAIWNRDASDAKITDNIRNTVRSILSLPPHTVMEYKSNNESIQDKSSFRT